MQDKTYIADACELEPTVSQIGTTLESLAQTITARRGAGEESYTYRLLTSSPDVVLKKLMEESGEVALAAKDVESWATSSLAAAFASEADADVENIQVHLPEEYSHSIDHLRYEAADVVYHLLVILERYGITLDEFAAELNERMSDSERKPGAIRLVPEHINRGK